MRNYCTFLKKEFVESFRSYRLLIMVIVFLIIGIMNPLFAYMVPIILESVMPPEMLFMEIPTPTALDSWAQFFGNTTQMGFLTVLIVFSSILSRELSRGTLINLVTKGLKRHIIILAKYTYLLLMWTGLYLINFAISFGYTVFLFGSAYMPNLAFSIFMLWLFGIFLLSLMMISATLVKSGYGTLLISGGVIVVLMLLNIIPDVVRFNPITLSSQNLAIIMETMEPATLYPLIGITVGVSLLFVALATVLFRKKQL